MCSGVSLCVVCISLSLPYVPPDVAGRGSVIDLVAFGVVFGGGDVVG